MRHLQRGITISGLVYTCIIFGFVAVVAMKLFPLYNEKMKVDFGLEKVATTPGSGTKSKVELVKHILRQFEVSDVDVWGAKELVSVLKIVKPKGSKTKIMSLDYEIRGPLFGDLDVVLKYSKSIPLDNSGG